MIPCAHTVQNRSRTDRDSRDTQLDVAASCIPWPVRGIDQRYALRTGVRTSRKQCSNRKPGYSAADDDDVEAFFHDSGIPRASLGNRPARPIM